MVATTILAYLVNCVTFIFAFLDLFHLRFHTLDPTQDTHTYARRLIKVRRPSAAGVSCSLNLNLGAECQNLQRQGSKTAITLKPKARDSLTTPCKKYTLLQAASASLPSRSKALLWSVSLEHDFQGVNRS